ncbi:MAG: hypothetical protein K9K86_01725 [Pseudomonadales bacterium]|nr:hypothetical protein [Pseudomonadales bacterium]
MVPGTDPPERDFRIWPLDKFVKQRTATSDTDAVCRHTGVGEVHSR